MNILTFFWGGGAQFRISSYSYSRLHSKDILKKYLYIYIYIYTHIYIYMTIYVSTLGMPRFVGTHGVFVIPKTLDRLGVFYWGRLIGCHGGEGFVSKLIGVLTQK